MKSYNDAFKVICNLIQKQQVTYEEAFDLLNEFFKEDTKVFYPTPSTRPYIDDVYPYTPSIYPYTPSMPQVWYGNTTTDGKPTFTSTSSEAQRSWNDK